MRHSLLAEPRKCAKMSFWNESRLSWRFIRSLIVSYLSRPSQWVQRKRRKGAHPSFGSSTPRSEMYSSYSNRPLKSGCIRWNLSLARIRVTYARMSEP